MVRFRVIYRKVGPIRFASHRDIMRAFRRGFTAGRVPVCYSQGFNPHPRISFGPSLRTGWEGLGECMDIDLEEPVADLAERCNPRLPDGLEIVESVEVEERTPKLSTDVTAARYEVTIDPDNLSMEHNPTWASFARTNGLDDVPATDERVGTAMVADIEGRFPSGADAEPIPDPELLEIKTFTREGSLCIEYLSRMDQGKSLFPERMLENILGPHQNQIVPWKIVRKELLVERGNALQPPTSAQVVQART